MNNESTKMPTALFVVVQKEAHGIVILKRKSKVRVTTTFRHSKALACESQGFVIF